MFLCNFILYGIHAATATATIDIENCSISQKELPHSSYFLIFAPALILLSVPLLPNSHSSVISTILLV
jgi:hypothetical protein